MNASVPLILVSTEKSTLERFPTVVIENIEPCIDGGRYFVILDPHTRPAHVFRLRRLIARRGEEMVFA